MNFIGTLGYSIVIPFLVVLVTKFGGNALVYGLLSATYSFFQLLGAPVLGRWSDSYGRRKVLLLSQLGTLAAWVIFLVGLYLPNAALLDVRSSLLGTFVFTLPLFVLFLARALDGATGGNVSVANAYLADITTEKDRNANFGKMAISSNLGFIVGPALAGVLGGTVLGEGLPVMAALFISLVAVFLIAFGLPESKPCVIDCRLEQPTVRKVFGQEHKECYRMRCPMERQPGFQEIVSIENVPYLLTLYFLIFLGFNLFYAAFPILAVQGWGWSITRVGIFFSILSFMMILVQGPVLRRASKMLSDGWLVLVGNLLLGSGFILLMFPKEAFVYGGAALFALGNGLMWPSFLSLLSKVAGLQYQGAVQGLASSAGSLASIVGLIAGGILYGLLGAATLLGSALLIYLVFLLSFPLFRLEKNLPHT
ncbi:MAG: MFS transporter [Candidatus Binatia bacterium]